VGAPAGEAGAPVGCDAGIAKGDGGGSARVGGIESTIRLMGEVMEYAAGIASDNPRLRRQLEDVLNRVDAHERGETELMQRMLYNDIGEGD